MALIVGLGNPGPKYAETRHNAGFLVVDELARRWGARFSRGRNADVARGEPPWAAHRLVKPQTFMNVSGRAVQGAMTRHGVRPADLLVVHDDLDLPFGRLRFKRGGGAGGQRGVKDIAARIGPDFDRLKIGIGRPPERWTVENWVLSGFRPDERPILDEVVRAAADGVTVWLERDLDEAMNRVNGLDFAPAPAGAAEDSDARIADDAEEAEGAA